jgi:glycosyltransferase involved in cell wall biosynthesis
VSTPLKTTHVLWLSERENVPAFAGAETHLLTLLPALVRAGVDVELLAIILNEGPQIREKLAWLSGQQVRVTPLHIRITHRHKRRDPRLLYYFFHLTRLLRQRRDRIVHTHLDWIYTPLAAAIARQPAVVTSIHLDDPQWLTPRWRLWLRLMDPIVSRYICITDRVASHFTMAVPRAASRVRRIYYGVAPPPPQRTRSVLRDELGLNADDFVIGFVGRLAAQKNLGRLMAAAAKRRNVTFALIGDGPDRAALMDAARSLHNVRFLGYRADAPDHMPAFDALCLPSTYEGLGLVLVEAMVRGVLTLGSDAGAIPEILGRGRYGVLFDHTRDGALEEAIDWIRENPDASRQLAEKGRQYALETFTMDAMVDQTIRIYQDVQAVAA